ncbi:hypothetical protein CWI39_2821p0010, partial [Hamiltosporidium magnivora]
MRKHHTNPTKQEYLDKDFNYKNLTKNQIASILSECNCTVPNIPTTKKNEFFKIYKTEIFDRIEELKSKYLNVKPDGRDIERVDKVRGDSVKEDRDRRDSIKEDRDRRDSIRNIANTRDTRDSRNIANTRDITNTRDTKDTRDIQNINTRDLYKSGNESVFTEDNPFQSETDVSKTPNRSKLGNNFVRLSVNKEKRHKKREENEESEESMSSSSKDYDSNSSRDIYKESKDYSSSPLVKKRGRRVKNVSPLSNKSGDKRVSLSKSPLKYKRESLGRLGDRGVISKEYDYKGVSDRYVDNPLTS